jgi:hypothetical protein
MQKEREDEERGAGASWWVSHADWTGRCDSGGSQTSTIEACMPPRRRPGMRQPLSRANTHDATP